MNQLDGLTMLAEAGLDFAQNTLGEMYANGDGVPQDFEKAFAWIQKAADQGNADALSNLERMRLIPLALEALEKEGL